MTSERKAVLTGGCQCGAVRFAAYAGPVKIGLCHCRMCQKAVGGPFISLAEVKHEDFAWTRGKPATYRSSTIAERDFCAACGTPLSYRVIDGNDHRAYHRQFRPAGPRGSDLRHRHRVPFGLGRQDRRSARQEHA